MADDEKPGMDEDLDEEVRHEAAVIIQKHWRESNMRQLAMDQLDDDEPVITEHERKLQLIEDFKEELDMRDKMLEENMRMQRALSRHFDQKKQADQDKGGEAQSQAELENKYVLLLEELRRGRLELEALKEQNQEDLDIAKEKMNNYQQKATEYELSFRRHKREIAEKAGFSRNKKPIPKKRLDLNDQMEEQGSQEVKLARIGYIKMRNRAKKLSEQLKEKEKLTDGLHLIDFEQLKIENTTLNEKIEERNEEVLKLKKKATTTIHILTHVKEKLQYIQGENMTLKKTLEQLDTTLDENRAKMTEVKKDRDVFASENVKMREKMPMIGSEDLLMDYELRKQQIETLRIEVVEKTNHHHELMLWIDKWQPTVHQRQAQVQSEVRVTR